LATTGQEVAVYVVRYVGMDSSGEPYGVRLKGQSSADELHFDREGEWKSKADD
jgi:hypothetical protein